MLICKNCFDNRKLGEQEKSLSRAWNVPLKKLQCHLNPQFVRWWWFLFSFDFYELLTIKNLLTPCDEHESKLDLTPHKFENSLSKFALRFNQLKTSRICCQNSNSHFQQELDTIEVFKQVNWINGRSMKDTEVKGISFLWG